MAYERICAIIGEQLGIDPKGITRETRFVEDLRADSLTMVELILTLEEEFGMGATPEEELMNMKTVGDLADYADRVSKEG